MIHEPAVTNANIYAMPEQTKGPYIPLPTGRRDGNSSNAADVAANSPAPGATVNDLLTIFAKFNFTAKDLAVLSGTYAHTLYICTFRNLVLSDVLYV